MGKYPGAESSLAAAGSRSAGTKARNLPESVNRCVPVGTAGQATSLRVQSWRALARKVVKQIEAPRSPDPIMRRPCADCEEKRVTYGDDEPDDDADQEQDRKSKRLNSSH